MCLVCITTLHTEYECVLLTIQQCGINELILVFLSQFQRLSAPWTILDNPMASIFVSLNNRSKDNPVHDFILL